ncbi:hypothetical protein HDV00_010085, partial [Rhizophlyctis rosea]
KTAAFVIKRSPVTASTVSTGARSVSEKEKKGTPLPPLLVRNIRLKVVGDVYKQYCSFGVPKGSAALPVTVRVSNKLNGIGTKMRSSWDFCREQRLECKKLTGGAIGLILYKFKCTLQRLNGPAFLNALREIGERISGTKGDGALDDILGYVASRNAVVVDGGRYTLHRLTGVECISGGEMRHDGVLAEDEDEEKDDDATISGNSDASAYELTAGSERVSLKDPLSLVRICMPVRGRHCQHKQAFDLATFVTLEEDVKHTGRCPDLVEDPLFTLLLHIYPTDDFIWLLPDGSHRPDKAKSPSIDGTIIAEELSGAELLTPETNGDPIHHTKLDLPRVLRGGEDGGDEDGVTVAVDEIARQLAQRPVGRRGLTLVEHAGGIVNIGATCYMAAVVQMLYYSSFADSLLTTGFGSTGLYTVILNELFLAKNEKREMDVATLQVATCDGVQFVENRQEDAHEFLQHLIAQVALESIPGDSPVKTSLAWEMLMTRKCIACPIESDTTEAEIVWSLKMTTVPVNRVLSVDEYLRMYMARERYTYSCQCGDKWSTISRRPNTLPAVLILHLARFGFRGGDAFGTKRFDPVNIDVVLRLQEAGSETNVCFMLRGLIMHYGWTLKSGHYVYAAFDSTDGSWTLYDDDVVRPKCENPTRENQNVYMLLYQRVEESVVMSISPSEVVTSSSDIPVKVVEPTLSGIPENGVDFGDDELSRVKEQLARTEDILTYWKQKFDEISVKLYHVKKGLRTEKCTSADLRAEVQVLKEENDRLKTESGEIRGAGEDELDESKHAEIITLLQSVFKPTDGQTEIVLDWEMLDKRTAYRLYQFVKKQIRGRSAPGMQTTTLSLGHNDASVDGGDHFGDASLMDIDPVFPNASSPSLPGVTNPALAALQKLSQIDVMRNQPTPQQPTMQNPSAPQMTQISQLTQLPQMAQFNQPHANGTPAQTADVEQMQQPQLAPAQQQQSLQLLQQQHLAQNDHISPKSCGNETTNPNAAAAAFGEYDSILSQEADGAAPDDVAVEDAAMLLASDDGNEVDEDGGLLAGGEKMGSSTLSDTGMLMPLEDGSPRGEGRRKEGGSTEPRRRSSSSPPFYERYRNAGWMAPFPVGTVEGAGDMTVQYGTLISVVPVRTQKLHQPHQLQHEQPQQQQQPQAYAQVITSPPQQTYESLTSPDKERERGESAAGESSDADNDTAEDGGDSDASHTLMGEKHGDHLTKMQRGEEGLAIFDALFNFACPKFISPVRPNYDVPVNTAHVPTFCSQLLVPTIRSSLKLYTTLGVGKLAAFLDVSPEEVRTLLLVFKHKTRQRRWANGSVIEGDFGPTSDLDFHLKQVCFAKDTTYGFLLDT